MAKLTHTDDEGKARMVDIGGKAPMKRTARATGHITLSAEARELIKEDNIKKGDVLTVAEVAGIQAAKRTASLIPLCHSISCDWIYVKALPDETGITVESEIQSTGKTGVEMEALTAVSIALLTVYDMCKAVDKNMLIENIRLTEKTKESV